MKTPEKNQKRMKTSSFGQIGLIVALGITLVGFEYANVDVIRQKVTTAKLDAVEIETIYDKVEIEKPDVPKENQQENQQQNTSTNPNQQQQNTNIQTTTDPNEVDLNANTNFGDTVVVVQDVFRNTGPDLRGQIFDVVEQMPTYKDLVPIKDKEKQKAMTEKELLQNIYKNIKYPEIPRQMGIQGKVYVQFVVNTNGAITDVSILRGVHADLDNEVLRVVKMLPSMEPGRQRDQPVKVRYTMPIIFSLKK